MCTKVFFCFVCSCISKFIHCLIFVVSFTVAVPVDHCSASPKKGSRLLFGCGLSAVDDLMRTGTVQSSCIAVCMVGLYDWYILLTLVNSPRRALSMKLDVNGWHCSFIRSSCASAF